MPPRQPRALGLYIHIPFCGAICHYCNFNRGLHDGTLAARYVDALERDIRRQADQAPADTVYFGGGTPSLLPPEDIGRLIAACRDSFTLADDAEITLETNPETVTVARMEAYRAAGVNRISMGAQSFRDEELARLGRVHNAARVREAFAQTRQAGFDNISLDLMMWLPQQTLDDWMESIDGLVELGPEHASIYLLELYPNAPLREDMARSRLVAGAGRRRGGHVSARVRAARRGGLPAVRDFERRARGARVASQSEILARRRVDGVRVWRARHTRRAPLARGLRHGRLHSANSRRRRHRRGGADAVGTTSASKRCCSRDCG